MSIKGRTRAAFRRNSSVIALVVVLCFVILLECLGYMSLACSPAEFMEKQEVQKYENSIENVTEMNGLERTEFYLSNNLGVAGVYVLGTPTYFGFTLLMLNNYTNGMFLSYWYHDQGPGYLLAFFSSIFMHGMLELTGLFIIAAVTLRAAWNIWKGFGRMIAVAHGRKKFWRVLEAEKRQIGKQKGEIKRFLVDFAILTSAGALMIFLAAPIEAYISPGVGATFVEAPVLAVAFLAVITLFYFSIIAWGFKAMKKDAKRMFRDIKLGFRRKWRPTHLSLLMFVAFTTFFFVAHSLSL